MPLNSLQRKSVERLSVVIRLRDVERLTFRTVASQLGVSVGRAKQLHSKAQWYVRHGFMDSQGNATTPAGPERPPKPPVKPIDQTAQLCQQCVRCLAPLDERTWARGRVFCNQCVNQHAPWSDLTDLPARLRNPLMRAGFVYRSDVAEAPDNWLSVLSNIGPKSLTALRALVPTARGTCPMCGGAGQIVIT